MVTYSSVKLYASFKVNNREYYEDSLHKPRFPAPVDSTSTPPSIGTALYTFGSATPRKGHELDEIELNLDASVFEVTGPLNPTPKLICL